MSSALQHTGDPVQIIYLVRMVPDDPGSVLLLPGASADQICVVVFNQPETANQFVLDYPDAQPEWLVTPFAVIDLPALLHTQAQQGRTHVMVDPHVAAGPVVPTAIVPIRDYIAAIR